MSTYVHACIYIWCVCVCVHMNVVCECLHAFMSGQWLSGDSDQMALYTI